ncbi:hypothetical protein HOLleu_13690 [Holothuria leucospilota]|uniref:Uncharacterized protein n=1 Tax=Holothuria leucospilota TaxID=206669 RepID=A0A9Q1C5G8_HOLLE|nr:hypothetical protein HOLleu_13690 [Holothuria leucospilota]
MFHLDNLDHPVIPPPSQSPNQVIPFLVKNAFISLLPKLGMSCLVQLHRPHL